MNGALDLVTEMAEYGRLFLIDFADWIVTCPTAFLFTVLAILSVTVLWFRRFV